MEVEEERKPKRLKASGVNNVVRPNLLDDDFAGDCSVTEHAFKINEDFARRFEHNKKREELHQCQFFSGPRYVLR